MPKKTKLQQQLDEQESKLVKMRIKILMQLTEIDYYLARIRGGNVIEEIVKEINSPDEAILKN